VLLEDAQLKKTLRKSKRETHKLQASGSRVLDMSKADSSDSDNESWGDSEDESDDVYDEDGNDDKDGNGDDSGNDDDGGNDAQDSEWTDSDDEKNPSFTLKDYEKEEQEDEYVHTQETDKSDDEENMHEEEDDDVAKELYGDLNITQGLKDTDMTNVEQGGEDQQNASHESGLCKKKMMLLNLDNTGPDVNEIASLMNTLTVPPPPSPANPSSHLTTIPQQQTPDSTRTTTNPIMTLPKIPNFASLFQFDQKVSALETKMSEFNQTSQFTEAVSSIPGIVDQYLASKMKEAVDVAVRL
ncbi:hypothetical protein Tco_0829958, partial [Tanacetum coccineum]